MPRKQECAKNPRSRAPSARPELFSCARRGWFDGSWRLEHFCLGASIVLIGLLAAEAASAQLVRRADPDDLQRQAVRDREQNEQAMRRALAGSRLEIVPARPVQGHTVRARITVLYGAAPAGHCPEPASVALRREGARTIVSMPSSPCANPLERSHWAAELPLGRLPAGEHAIELEVSNELGLAPVKSATVTVRRPVSPEEALAVATDEGAAEVAAVLAGNRFTPDGLDAVLSHACQRDRGPEGPVIVRALLAGGARPAAALHTAAIGSPGCLRELLDAGADPDLDIARADGIRLGSAPEAPRFKPAPAGTPLYFAVRGRHAGNVRTLLEAGADPNKQFGTGHSAYAETYAFGDDAAALEIRHLLQARGGALTLAQRVAMAGRQVGGVARAGVFLAICQLAAWSSGSCMH